jgi:uncharacterized membrane protein YfcA
MYALSGLVVGLLVGLTGTGGGSLMTPLLVLLFHVHPATAVGTDLLFTAITKIVGTAVHGSKGTIDWRLVGRLAAGSVPATVLTMVVLWLLRGPAGDPHAAAGLSALTSVLTTALGVAVMITALTLLVRPWLLARFSGAAPMSPRKVTVLAVTLGAALGVMVSLSSVGAGAIGVSALMALYPRMPLGRLVGSDIAHAVPLTLIAGAGYWLLGSIDWALLASLLAGSIPGITVGSLLASRSPDRVLRYVLAVMLLIVGGKLVFF